MYPYFIIQGYKIYAVGVGIVVSVLVAIAIVLYFTKKYRLQFSKFFYWLPTLAILTYILGNWIGLFFDEGIWFPFRSWKTFLALLSPYGYHFHFVGLVLGASIARRKFFKKIFMKTEKDKRVDTFFFSFAAMLVPLGIFLLLGDTFVGKPTDAWYGVMALLNDSALVNYGHVLPIGLMVSVFGFLTYLGIYFSRKFLSRERVWGYLGFAILFLLFNIVFIGETYVRHGVVNIANYSLDIKNYLTTFIALYFFIQFLRSSKGGRVLVE